MQINSPPPVRRRPDAAGNLPDAHRRIQGMRHSGSLRHPGPPGNGIHGVGLSRNHCLQQRQRRNRLPVRVHHRKHAAHNHAGIYRQKRCGHPGRQTADGKHDGECQTPVPGHPLTT